MRNQRCQRYPHTLANRHMRTHTQTETNTELRKLTVFWIGGVGVTWLCSPCSLLRQWDKWGCYRQLSDRRFTLQEPITVWYGAGRVGPTFSPLSCRVSINTEDHPIHPHLGDYTAFFPCYRACHSSQYLQQRTSAQGIQLSLVYILSDTCWREVLFHLTSIFYDIF